MLIKFVDMVLELHRLFHTFLVQTVLPMVHMLVIIGQRLENLQRQVNGENRISYQIIEVNKLKIRRSGPRGDVWVLSCNDVIIVLCLI